jgi:hypothetical protein
VRLIFTGQRFCPSCGKEVVGGAQWEQLRRGRVSAHIRLLGILWLAISAFNTLSGLAILLVAKPVLLHLRELGEGPPQFVQGFLQPLLILVAIFVLSKALLGFAAGWGLLHRESWARIVALIGGFLALFHPPFGTGYTRFGYCCRPNLIANIRASGAGCVTFVASSRCR